VGQRSSEVEKRKSFRIGKQQSSQEAVQAYPQEERPKSGASQFAVTIHRFMQHLIAGVVETGIGLSGDRNS